MKIIESINNPFIKEIQKLYQKKTRDEKKQFLVEGYHTVLAAQVDNNLKTVIIVNKKDYIPGVENILVPPFIMEKLTKSVTPQPIVGVCNYINSRPFENGKYLILDDIKDPGNMGTIIRSAVGFNINHIIVSEECVDIYNDKVLRATQGAIFNITITKADIITAIKQLKYMNIPIVGTSIVGGEELSVIKKPKYFALVLGNESLGVSESITQLCDININIETSSKLESLNVAIAGSIIMYFFK